MKSYFSSVIVFTAASFTLSWKVLPSFSGAMALVVALSRSAVTWRAPGLVKRRDPTPIPRRIFSMGLPVLLSRSWWSLPEQVLSVLWLIDRFQPLPLDGAPGTLSCRRSWVSLKVSSCLWVVYPSYGSKHYFLLLLLYTRSPTIPVTNPASTIKHHSKIP